MFNRTSRYSAAGTYAVRTASGTTVTVIRLPLPRAPVVRGIHPRSEGQRLDQIASHYLADATAFWRLCDASDAVAPDALAVRDRIPVPDKER